MASKRKRTESEMEEEANKSEDTGTVSRSGRVRKKSAKLKEMEEGEIALATLESKGKGKKKGKAEETGEASKKSPAKAKLVTIQPTEPAAPTATPVTVSPKSMVVSETPEEMLGLSATVAQLPSPSTSAAQLFPAVKQEEVPEQSGLKVRTDTVLIVKAEPGTAYSADTGSGHIVEEVESENDTSSGEDEDDLEDDLGEDAEDVDFLEAEDEEAEFEEEIEGEEEEIDVSSPSQEPALTKSSQALMNVLSQAPGPSMQVDVKPVYSNTQEMAMKVKTSAERRASKRKKSDLPPTVTKTGRLKSKRPTAYTMFCREYREKVFAENPFINPSDFAQISRRLGEIWHTIPEKEKQNFKRKARTYAGRLKRAMTAGAIPKKKKSGQTKHLKSGAGNAKAEEVANKISTQLTGKYSGTAAAQEAVAGIPTSPPPGEMPPAVAPGSGIEPIDIAAHMTLLGNSLSIIGANLQEAQETQTVQGALSVLLDTMLSGLAPLMCLTKLVPNMDSIPQEQLNQMLDNIAYIMPGL